MIWDTGGLWLPYWSSILLSFIILSVRCMHEFVEQSWDTIWDLIMFAALLLLSNFDTIPQTVRSVLPPFHNLLESAGCILTATCLYELRGVFKRSKREQSVNAAADDENNFLRPLLLPCRTTHTRVAPKLHSFSYSYLLVGVPVGWRGSADGMISADVDLPNKQEPGQLSRGWFHVDAADHLDRGEVQLGLRGKLHAYLKDQGELPESYPYAYLVTAPRFLGYTFNPVSFWYLYDAQRQLRAMILEVNNTFDERRMYLLRRPDEVKGETMLEDVNGLSILSRNFTGKWPKDFHVSPFNSRKGSYSLNSLDPFSKEGESAGKVYNTIILRSSKNVAKITAKVFSTKPALDPLNMTFQAKLAFLLAWWWVGFVTFPRIVKEASKLFFRKKLHVWYRPEVLKDSIGRTETVQERIIEIHLREFLKYQVECSPKGIGLRYIASGTYCKRTETFLSRNLGNFNLRTTDSKASSNDPSSTLELKVLTPLFYSRLIRYAHITEFLSDEILQNDDSNRTFWANDSKTLLELMHYTPKDANPEVMKRSKMGLLNRIRWTVLRKLRVSPQAPKQNFSIADSSSLKVTQSYIHRFMFSSLDQFVINHCAASEARKYRRAAGTLLLSDRIALGSVELLLLIDILIRLALCYMLIWAIRPVMMETGQWIKMRMAHEDANEVLCYYPQWLQRPPKNWRRFLREYGPIECLLWFNGLQIWAWVKKML